MCRYKSKNLYKYLHELNDKEIITSFDVSSKIRIYKLSQNYDWVRKYFKRD